MLRRIIDLITTIQRRFRFLNTIPLGILTEDQIKQQTLMGKDLFIDLATIEIAELAIASESLLFDSSSLAEKEHSSLSQTNIRVYVDYISGYKPSKRPCSSRDYFVEG